MVKQKDFLNGLGNLIKEHWKSYWAREKKYKNKYNSLNFEERESYDELVYKNYRGFSFIYLTFPFKATFYLALFSIVLLFGFQINLIDSLIVLVSALFMLYPIYILIFFLEVILIDGRLQKRKREVLDYLK